MCFCGPARTRDRFPLPLLAIGEQLDASVLFAANAALAAPNFLNAGMSGRRAVEACQKPTAAQKTVQRLSVD